MNISTNCCKSIIWLFLAVFIFFLIMVPAGVAESQNLSEEEIESAESSQNLTDSGSAEQDLNADEVESEMSEMSLDSVESPMGMSSSTPTSGSSAGESTGYPAPVIDTYESTGAARAIIPVIVPPGRGGMAPDLNLTYNSYKKNGWIGVGWQLDLGAIQRSTKRGVDYNADDYVKVVYSDFSELVPRTEWGQNYYGAKIEGEFAKYYKNPAGGWEVSTRDGRTYYYGTSAASRQDSAGKIFKWCLDRVEDANGNYMTVSYTKDQGEIYLDRIDYTGNVSLTPSNYVQFHLEQRPDAPAMYNANFKVVTAKRLKTIEIFGNDQLARKYELSYNLSTSTLRTLLDSVLQLGSDGVAEKPEISIDWQEGGEKLAYSGTGTGGTHARWTTVIDSSTYKGKAFTGDFNGDGRTDLMMIYRDPNEPVVTIFHWHADANGKLYFAGRGSGGTHARWTTVIDSPTYKGKAFTGDFNGDGRTDLMMIYRDPNEPVVTIFHWHADANGKLYFAGRGSGGTHARWTTVIDSPTYKGKAFTGDFNGDGRTDLMMIYRDPNEPVVTIFHWHADANGKLYFAGRGSGGTHARWTTVVDSLKYKGKAFTGDFNGDGRTDLMMIYRDPSSPVVTIYHWHADASGKLYFAGRGSGGTHARWTTVVDSLKYKGKAFTGDFNGDGRTDLMMIYRDPSSPVVTIYHWHADASGKLYYAGRGSGGTHARWTTVVDSPTYKGKAFTGDFNGDGKTDLMMIYRDPSSPVVTIYHWHADANGKLYYAGRGSGGTHARWTTVVDSLKYKGKAFTGDFNGDGKTDLMMIYRDPDAPVVSIYHWHAELPFADLLQSMTNTQGGTTTIEYTPSSQYENTLLPFIVHPVSRISVNDGNGVVSETSYSYSGGLYDYATREFRGFATVTRTNSDGTTVKTKFHQDEYFKGRQYQIESNEPDAGPLLSKTTLTWDKEFPDAPDNTWAFVNLSQKRTEFYDDVTVYTQEAHTYDNTNGNLLTTVVEGTDAESITKTNQYQNFGDWTWRLTQETVIGDNSGKVRESFFEYETGAGNLLSKEFWLNTGTNPSINYTYDTYGNMVTETDAGGNTTTTEYETATYTYPDKIIYPQTGSVTHIVENEEYDYRYGKVIISKDENENRIYYDYDEFGRTVQVDFPDGGQVTTEYFDDVFPRYVITKVKEDASGNTIDKYEYFDGLGRTIQTITFGENNKSIVKKMFYDEMGRNYRVEGPFFSTGTGYPKAPPSSYPWMQTAYDLRGRPIEVESPDGQYGTIVSAMSYSGFSITTSDPDSSQKTERKDYLGRTIQVTEYADAGQYNTTYAYNAAGDILNVTDHLGNLTTINYDTLGRKIDMADPDMGFWEYIYDANGNIVTQTDEKDQVITFSHDQLNRVTQKAYSTSDPAVTYVYDNLSIPNGRGKLYSVSNTNVTTTYNSYDAMGRKTSVSKRITGAPTVYTTRYGYDLSGKPISTTFPDNYQVNNNYYPGTGLLSTVVGITDFTEYAELSAYKPTGKIGQVDYGNNTSTTYTYDPKSTRLTAILTQDSNQVDIQNRAYGYSPAGDIEQIIDNKNSITYTYAYDYLHRLTSETNTGSYDPVTYMYNAVGNITSKTVDTNTYNYAYADSSHKHAVSNINYNGNNHSYTYDANGNMTSGPDFSNPGRVNSRTIAFNGDNMPTLITHSIGGTTNVTYDGDSKRAKKVAPNGNITYYISNEYEIHDGTAIKYIFAGNLRIAQKTAAATHYFHKDHLGSSSTITDGNENAVETTEYMPYGETRKHTGTEVSNYKFTDQELDTSTNLYNYDARLYDPVIGRFISADTMVPDPFNPQDLNRYSYCRNNPLIYVDPSGHHLGGDNGPSDYNDLDDNPGGGRQSMGIDKDDYERDYTLNHMSYDRRTESFYYNDPNYGQRKVEPFKDKVPHFDWNKDRNVFNFTPLEIPKKYSLYVYKDKYGNLWKQDHWLTSAWFHGWGNTSFRGLGRIAGSQATYGPEEELVNSGPHIGTFDYGKAPSTMHNELDVAPHDPINDPYTEPDLSFQY